MSHGHKQGMSFIPFALILLMFLQSVVGAISSDGTGNGQISFTTAHYKVAALSEHEHSANVSFTLSRTNGSAGRVVGFISILPSSTMVHGEDYFSSGPGVAATFEEGQTEADFSFDLFQIPAANLPRSLELKLVSATNGATLGEITTATLTVGRSDLVPPSISLSQTDGVSAEPNYLVRGNVFDNSGVARVELKVNGVLHVVGIGELLNGRSKFEKAVLLENGLNKIEARAFDWNGLESGAASTSVEYRNNRPELAGSYFGVISDGNPAFVRLNLTSGGSFTGVIRIERKKVRIRGRLDNSGAARFGGSRQTAQLPAYFEFSSIDGVSSSVGAFAIRIVNDRICMIETSFGGTEDSGKRWPLARVYFDGKAPATTVGQNFLSTQGKYTFLLPARRIIESEEDFQFGGGFGLLNLSPKGIVTAVGTYRDGQPFSCSSPISEDYQWNFFARDPEYPRNFFALVKFDDSQPEHDAFADSIHDNSHFTPFLCSKFAAPKGSAIFPNMAVPSLSGNASIEFRDGNLLNPISKPINISPLNTVTEVASDGSVSVALDFRTGLMSGLFKHADGYRARFKGAIFQKGLHPRANGRFYGRPTTTVVWDEVLKVPGQSGRVRLEIK